MAFAPTFGSLGDFISIGILVAELVSAIRNTCGAAAEYQQVIQDLDNLEALVVQVDKTCKRHGGADGVLEIRVEIDKHVTQCHEKIATFLAKIRRYEASLGTGGSGSWIRDSGRRIRWKMEKNDVDSFRESIGLHTVHINALLTTMSLNLLDLSERPRERSLTPHRAGTPEELRGVVNTLRSCVELMQRTVPEMATEVLRIVKSNSDIYQEITAVKTSVESLSFNRPVLGNYSLLEDAAGRTLVVDFSFAPTWEILRTVLTMRFEDLACAGLIAQGGYVLEDAQIGQLVDETIPLQEAIRRGQHIRMLLLTTEPRSDDEFTTGLASMYNPRAAPYITGVTARGWGETPQSVGMVRNYSEQELSAAYSEEDLQFINPTGATVEGSQTNHSPESLVTTRQIWRRVADDDSISIFAPPDDKTAYIPSDVNGEGLGEMNWHQILLTYRTCVDTRAGMPSEASLEEDGLTLGVPSNWMDQPEWILGWRLHGVLELRSILSRGNLQGGKVVLNSVYLPTGQPFALKAFSLQGIPSVEMRRKRVARQILLHRRASGSRNVLDLVHFISRDEHIFAVLGLCHGGDLQSAIMDFRYADSHALIREDFLQIMNGVMHCHWCGVYTLDLMPAHILLSVSPDGVVLKLAGFGLASEAEFYTHSLEHPEKKLHSSRAYSAPESLNPVVGATYSRPAMDVWSLGVILLNMVTTKLPWASTQDAGFFAYAKNPETLKNKMALSSELLAVLQKIFRPPNERAGIREFKSDVETCARFHGEREFN